MDVLSIFNTLVMEQRLILCQQIIVETLSKQDTVNQMILQLGRFGPWTIRS